MGQTKTESNGLKENINTPVGKRMERVTSLDYSIIAKYTPDKGAAKVTLQTIIALEK